MEAAAAPADHEAANGNVAAAAAGHGDDGSLPPAQPDNKAEQLSYASIREAAAVNQAADSAADEAMRAVAAAQHALQLLMNPQQGDMMGHGMMGMEDDAGNNTHHPSGRARRRASAYMEQAAAAGLVGFSHNGMYVPGGRPNKGLRHFSMKVCEKVESKGTTSYNEVADELVAELKDGGMDDGICYDEKNIRRRVYDAINVLMALDIIAKEKKAIIWRGFPTQRSPAQQVCVCVCVCVVCLCTTTPPSGLRIGSAKRSCFYALACSCSCPLKAGPKQLHVPVCILLNSPLTCSCFCRVSAAAFRERDNWWLIGTKSAETT
jgi:hypothetical protein